MMLLSVPWRPDFCSCGGTWTLFISHLLQCLFKTSQMYFIQQPSRLYHEGPQEKFGLLKGLASHSTLPEGGKNRGSTPDSSLKCEKRRLSSEEPCQTSWMLTHVNVSSLLPLANLILAILLHPQTD